MVTCLSVEFPNLVQKCQAISVYSNTGDIDETNNVLGSKGPTKKIVQSVSKHVSQGVTKLSVVLVAARIIVDLWSLIYNAVNLAKFEEDKLCTEATKLQISSKWRRNISLKKDIQNLVNEKAISLSLCVNCKQPAYFLEYILFLL